MAEEGMVFELLVSSGVPGHYPVALTHSPAGTASGICTLNPFDPAFQADLERLQSGYTDDAFLYDFGARLFNSIFHDHVLDRFRSSLQLPRSRLAIHLRFDAPELSVLPWELLYDPAGDVFLAISPLTPVSRSLPNVGAALADLKPPLKVLIVFSVPIDLHKYLPSLDVNGEEQKIRTKLEKLIQAGQVELQILKHAIPANIRQVISDFRPHIFHYIGHGNFDEHSQTAQIILEQEDGYAIFMDERGFREFFNGQTQTRLVVINACESGKTGSSQALSGLAPRLLQRNVPAVVAMQYRVPDNTALIFSNEFYRSLASGDWSDVAVTEGRRALYQDIGSDHVDWAMPVLFLGAPAERLFTLVLDGVPPYEDELSAGLFEEVRKALLACGPFQSDQQIYAVFIHPLLAPYRNQLPQAASVAGRVEGIMEFLLGVGGTSLLTILLRVLSARWDVVTDCHHRLASLARRIENLPNQEK